MQAGAFRTPPQGMGMAGREGLAASMPPGGGGEPARTRARGASPRRKLDEVLGATAMSPVAKRAARYQTPEPAGGPEMTTAQLSTEVYLIKAAVASMHTWMLGIEETVDGHADHLESAAKDVKMITNNLGRFEQQIGNGQAEAEAKITGVFAKVDAMIQELRGETKTEVAGIGVKIVDIEMKLAHLHSSGPMPTPPAAPPGIADPAGIQATIAEIQKNIAGCADGMVAARGRMDGLTATLDSFQTAVAEQYSKIEHAIGGLSGRVALVESGRAAGAGVGADPFQAHCPWAAGREAAGGDQMGGAATAGGGLFGGAAGGATHPNIGTPARAPVQRAERAPYDPQWRFDSKLDRIPSMPTTSRTSQIG